MAYQTFFEHRKTAGHTEPAAAEESEVARLRAQVQRLQTMIESGV